MSPQLACFSHKLTFTSPKLVYIGPSLAHMTCPFIHTLLGLGCHLDPCGCPSNPSDHFALSFEISDWLSHGASPLTLIESLENHLLGSKSFSACLVTPHRQSDYSGLLAECSSYPALSPSCSLDWLFGCIPNGGQSPVEW